MIHSLSAIAFLVPSYEEGRSFFCDVLGFEVVEDTDLGHDKRWVAVAPAGGRGATLILAVPAIAGSGPGSAIRPVDGWVTSS